MKTVKLFILCILCFQTVLFGQDQALKMTKWTVYTSAFSYLPDRLNSASYNLGLDMPINTDKSFYVNAGFIHSYGPSSGLFYLNAEKNIGVHLIAELKNYLNRRTFYMKPLPRDRTLYPNSGAYYAFELFSQYSYTTREEGVSERIETGIYPEFIHYRNTYYVNRFAFGSLLNVGYKVVGENGFTRDFTLGLGAQLVHSYYRDRIEDDRGWPNQQKEGIWVHKVFDHGTALLPYIQLRLKLGWSVFE